MSRPPHLVPFSVAGLAISTGPAWGHEAWLLTPNEIARLSVTPVPALFTSTIVMGLSALLGVSVAVMALTLERKALPYENRLLAPIASLAGDIGPLFIRIGLAIMLGLGALGCLPRNGTALWAQPVLFVPDMQLSLVPGFTWLAPIQFLAAVLLASGLMTRATAAIVVVMAVLGVVAFGVEFLSYAPHFVAPALVLVVYGSGSFGMDRLPSLSVELETTEWGRQLTWRIVMFLTGATFVYLGIAVKLIEPTLLMAILEHGQVPRFGAPVEVVALVMAMVEIVAGGLLAMGRLVRPVALFLISAFTFFAVTIGETPLFHANLYGLAMMLAMAGRSAPAHSKLKFAAASTVRRS